LYAEQTTEQNGGWLYVVTELLIKTLPGGLLILWQPGVSMVN